MGWFWSAIWLSLSLSFCGVSNCEGLMLPEEMTFWRVLSTMMTGTRTLLLVTSVRNEVLRLSRVARISL